MEEHDRKKEPQRWSTRSIPLPSLRDLRRNRGLSQRDLGKIANVSPGTVYRLENELRGAYPSTLRKLATALGVQSVDLVREHRQ